MGCDFATTVGKMLIYSYHWFHSSSCTTRGRATPNFLTHRTAAKLATELTTKKPYIRIMDLLNSFSLLPLNLLGKYLPR
jgi:hypothetical protein